MIIREVNPPVKESRDSQITGRVSIIIEDLKEGGLLEARHYP